MIKPSARLLFLLLAGCQSNEPASPPSVTLSAVSEITDTARQTTSGCRISAFLPLDSVPQSGWISTGLVAFTRYQRSSTHAEVSTQLVDRHLTATGSFTGTHANNIAFASAPPFVLHGSLVFPPAYGPYLQGEWTCDASFPVAVDSALRAVGYDSVGIVPGSWTLEENLPVD